MNASSGWRGAGESSYRGCLEAEAGTCGENLLLPDQEGAEGGGSCGRSPGCRPRASCGQC